MAIFAHGFTKLESWEALVRTVLAVELWHGSAEVSPCAGDLCYQMLLTKENKNMPPAFKAVCCWRR